jgi:hypothetical protein
MAKSSLHTSRTVSVQEGLLRPSIRHLSPKRLYHAARLRWNSIERRRTPAEDQLVDDVTEWALWHYATGECHKWDFECILTIISARVRVHELMIVNPINVFTGLVSRY